MRLYKKIGKTFPKKIRLWTRQEVDYSSLKTNSDELIGFSIVFGAGLGVIGGLLSGRLAYVHPIFGALIFFAAFEFLIYLWLEFSADAKSRFVEESLPDALQIMSSNIRAGLTVDKALISSARKEFGPLGDEIRRVGKETMAGERITKSLLKIKRKVRSKYMDMAINLIVQSIESGGELADLLDETAADLRDQQITRKEIRSSVLMYVIFIFIAVGLGAPLLFAVSSMLVKTLSTNMALITSQMPAEMTAMTGMPIQVSESSVSTEFIAKYVTISLLVTSFFGSLTVGLILTGKEKTGLKFFPILIALTLGLYHLATYILDRFIGSMMEVAV